MDGKLAEYYQKRDMRQTPEPEGNNAALFHKEPVFVVQKHNASHLHYDFRLEADGVLKSWAIPKGPSNDTDQRRLAVPTEDHPLDYADFEGVIPEGNYGAGPVIVWDAGTYSNTSEKDGVRLSISEAWDKGHITVILKGQKLNGHYALIKTARGKSSQWLFFRMKNQPAALPIDPVTEQPKSVLSGRTIEDLEQHS